MIPDFTIEDRALSISSDVAGGVVGLSVVSSNRGGMVCLKRSVMRRSAHKMPGACARCLT